MQAVTSLWTFAAGALIVLGGLCGTAWMVERRAPASLMLCVLGIAAGTSAYIELGMMHSSTPAEYGELLRWYHVPASLALLAQVLFVHYFLGTSRLWLMWVVIFSRMLVLAVNVPLHPNMNFSTITSLRYVSLLGERVAELDTAVIRVCWQLFAAASLSLLVAYLADAAIQRWRRGDKASQRRALVVILGLIIPMLIELLYVQLLIFGVFHGPLSNLPWFLGAQLIMANELVRDVILSRRTLRKSAELQSQLARVERLNILGQLASSLAHELSQPLAANTLNASVALTKLTGEAPDLEDLRTILSDIETGSQRVAELCTRMRKFAKSRAIELHPLAVEELVADVVLLVGADVKSKGVALTFDIQPGLPNALGDRVHLSQVLLNLLMNSIQAVQSCPPNERCIAIEAHEVLGNSRIEVTVRDTGHGVPNEVAEKIFLPFFTTKSDGMGMGLALSHDIIDAHGGHLWVDRTNRDDGSVFHFTLRRA
jgi:C4-dicarboxylate-specific signal transduction histidine kinase